MSMYIVAHMRALTVRCCTGCHDLVRCIQYSGFVWKTMLWGCVEKTENLNGLAMHVELTCCSVMVMECTWYPACI